MESASRPSAREAAGGSTSDGLATAYTAQADDAGSAEKKREAGVFFSVAERQLNDGDDLEVAKTAALDALRVFREAGDAVGIADSLRLVVHAERAKAEECRSQAEGEKKAQELLEAAAQLARDELARFREQGNTRGEAAMLLALAEVAVGSARPSVEQWDEALDFATRARELFQEAEDKRLEASALFAIFSLHNKKFLAQGGMEAASDALKLYKSMDDKVGLAKAWSVYAEARNLCQAPLDAVKATKQSLKLYREVGSKKQIASALLALGEGYLTVEKYREALLAAKEALMMFQEIECGNNRQPVSLGLAVRAYGGMGEKAKALQLAKEGLSTYQQAGDKRGELKVRDALVHVYLDQDGQDGIDDALQVAEESLQIAKELGDRTTEWQTWQTIALLHWRKQDQGKATEAINEAQAILQELGDDVEQGMLLDLLRDMHSENNEYEEAFQVADTQRGIFQKTGEKAREAVVMLRVCAIWCKKNHPKKVDLDAGMAAAKEAQFLFRDIGDKVGEASALSSISEIHLSGGGDKDKEPKPAMQTALEAQVMFQEAGGQQVREALLCRTIAKIQMENEAFADAVKTATQGAALAKKSEDQKRLVEMMVFFSHTTTAATVHQANASKNAYRIVSRGGGKALKAAKEAMGLAKKLRDRALLGISMYAVADAQQLLGKFDEALKSAAQAAALFKETNSKHAEVSATCLSGEILFESGNAAKATDMANMAIALAQAVPDAWGEQRAHQLLQRIQGGPEITNQIAYVDAQQYQQEMAASSAAVAPVKKQGMDPAMVRNVIAQVVKGVVIADEDIIALDSPLMEVGMDSLSSVAFRNSLNQQLKTNLPASLMFDYPNQRSIAAHIIEMSKE